MIIKMDLKETRVGDIFSFWHLNNHVILEKFDDGGVCVGFIDDEGYVVRQNILSFRNDYFYKNYTLIVRANNGY